MLPLGLAQRQRHEAEQQRIRQVADAFRQRREPPGEGDFESAPLESVADQPRRLFRLDQKRLLKSVSWSVIGVRTKPWLTTWMVSPLLS